MLAISNGYFSNHFFYRRVIEVPTRESGIDFGNDPAAGSPTATLLRLLLPLVGGHRANSLLYAEGTGLLGSLSPYHR